MRGLIKIAQICFIFLKQVKTINLEKKYKKLKMQLVIYFLTEKNNETNRKNLSIALS